MSNDGQILTLDLTHTRHTFIRMYEGSLKIGMYVLDLHLTFFLMKLIINPYTTKE